MRRTKILIALIILLSCILVYKSFLGNQEKIINKNIKTVNLDVKYPQTANLKDKALQKQINDFLYAKAFEHIKAQKFTKDEEKTISYFAIYEVAKFTSPLLSVKFDESFMFKHMAHPNNAVKSITLNLKTGKVYSLKDLFKGDFEKRLNQLIKEEVAKREPPLLTPFKGIDKDQEFYLTKDSLVIYFQEYLYTCHAEGPLFIYIPYSSIKDILRSSEISG
ncbi:MAG: DUF3298 domain-containing protein [Candidatus Margulisiibacteriota bacterium]